jgi:hypothetical protein
VTMKMRMRMTMSKRERRWGENQIGTDCDSWRHSSAYCVYRCSCFQPVPAADPDPEVEGSPYEAGQGFGL